MSTDTFATNDRFAGAVIQIQVNGANTSYALERRGFTRPNHPNLQPPGHTADTGAGP